MAHGAPASAVRDLGTLLRDGAVGTQGDAELLERFLASTGETAEDAFAAVVERHGPLVLGVCRRILRDPDDAEDAFQATFLVLARKARSIGRRELLANWLYGVAVRTARELRASRARRLAREGQVDPMTRQDPGPEESDGELRAALDGELSRLPDAFRAPIVLCDLQGKTHQEAARILGLPVGTVSSRLVRAREKLRTRLVRRGLTLSAAAVASFCTRQAAEASVPPALVSAAARAAARFVTGGTAVAGVPSTPASLAERVSRSVALGKASAAGTLTSGLLLAAAIGAATAGGLWLTQPGQASPFARAVEDDWSWVDRLANADQATKDRLKRCARSALENYAALHRLAYDFDLTREQFFNDGKNHFTFKTYPYKGRLFWNDGAMRYDYEGENPGPIDKQGNPLPCPRGTYSVLRTRDLAARIQDHELYGVVLQVDPPPRSLDDWRHGHDLDPWVSYASCFRPEPMTLREFWAGCRTIESEEDDQAIVLKLTYARNPGWLEIVCGKSVDLLPVRWHYGDVREGIKRTWGEETCVWKKSDGVWYPEHYMKTAYIGAEMRPTKEIDLWVSNLRANTGAKIPAAVFTLSDLPFPEGYGGWDTRAQPRGSLIRSGGVVRERRIGEPWKDRNSGPIPFPKLVEPSRRIEKDDYLALSAESAAKRREAEAALMKAKTEAEQAAAIEGLARTERAFAGRFLDLAEKHQGDPVAADALIQVATNQFTPAESGRAAELLIRDHLPGESFPRLLTELGSLHLALSRPAAKVLRAALEQAPTHEARARACLGLAQYLKYRARVLRRLSGPDPDPFWRLIARAVGGEALKDARPDAADALEREAVAFYSRLAEQFGDVSLRNEPAAEIARREVFQLRDLAVGRPAPEAEGMDVQGTPLKLGDFRGRVVVLAFSGPWNRDRTGPQMRALAARMKDRPFALLSVEIDPDKESLLAAIRDGQVTWRCWWEPSEDGPIRRRWQVHEFSSTFILDARGIIRARDLEGRALDRVVDELLKELGPKSAEGR
jgi:RNA polymerase sigma factor (sigma-70 family)